MKLSSGIIHFCDGGRVEYSDCEIQYTDHGIFSYAPEGNLFIPYGSIRLISEKI